MQHEPFSWQIKNSDFDYVENISGGAKYTNITINKWIKDMPDKKREKFVNQMFKGFICYKMKPTFYRLSYKLRKNLPIIMNEPRGLDDETKKIDV